MATNRLPEIVVISDHSGEAGLTRQAIEESGVACRVNVIEGAQDALQYLHQAGDENRLPELILLGYRMAMNGSGIIAEFRKQAVFGHLPILVLGGAGVADDLCAVYRLGANACYAKPLDFAGYQRLFQQVLPHWLGVASLPRCPPRW
jgi:CheY-like chemotaxis protein